MERLDMELVGDVITYRHPLTDAWKQVTFSGRYGHVYIKLKEEAVPKYITLWTEEIETDIPQRDEVEEVYSLDKGDVLDEGEGWLEAFCFLKRKV